MGNGSDRFHREYKQNAISTSDQGTLILMLYDGAIKNLQLAIESINLKDIEIFNDDYGKPFIQLKGSVANYIKKKIKNKKYYIYLSLSDDKPWAQATVIISHN